MSIISKGSHSICEGSADQIHLEVADGWLVGA